MTQPAPKAKHAVILAIAMFALFVGVPQLARYRKTGCAPAADAPTRDVSMNDYASLTDGMSYAEVVGMLKVSGVESGRSTVGDNTLVMYTWQNERGRGSLSVTFKNDRVMSKTQVGLK